MRELERDPLLGCALVQLLRALHRALEAHGRAGIRRRRERCFARSPGVVQRLAQVLAFAGLIEMVRELTEPARAVDIRERFQLARDSSVKSAPLAIREQRVGALQQQRVRKAKAMLATLHQDSDLQTLVDARE